MERSLWLYPWDIADLGAERVLTQADEWGFNCISVAMSYHAGRLLMPANPLRKVMFLQDGSIYFEPDMTLYDGGMCPRVAEPFAASGLLDKTATACRERNIGVTAWMVLLHNTYQGYQHPEACVQNAFGDRYYFSLCPSNERVRRYACGLLRDVTCNHEVDSVDIESLNYLGFAHGYHHELAGIAVDPVTSFLLSICFCPSCQERARRAGLRPEKTRCLVRSLIEQGLGQALPTHWARLAMNDPGSWKDTELGPYLAMRSDTVSSLLEEVRASVHQGVALRFIMRPSATAWQNGVDVDRIAQTSDAIVLCCYDPSPTQIEAWLSQTADEVRHRCPIVAAIRNIAPDTATRESFEAKLAVCRDSGVDGVAIYNYSLMSPSSMSWLSSLKRLA